MFQKPAHPKIVVTDQYDSGSYRPASCQTTIPTTCPLSTRILLSSKSPCVNNVFAIAVFCVYTYIEESGLKWCLPTSDKYWNKIVFPYRKPPSSCVGTQHPGIDFANTPTDPIDDRFLWPDICGTLDSVKCLPISYALMRYTSSEDARRHFDDEGGLFKRVMQMEFVDSWW